MDARLAGMQPHGDGFLVSTFAVGLAVMTFDPATSYAGDYAYFDFIEVADYYPSNEGLADSSDPLWRANIEGIIIREDDLTDPGYAQLTMGTTLVGSSSTAFVIWNPTDFDFFPRAGDIISRDDGSLWIIRTVRKQPFSRWIAMVDQAPENTVA